MSALIIRRAGPALSVQDKGRVGYMVQGLSRGGAADRLALAEGAVLLGQSGDFAALEMPGFGGVFEVIQDTRIALTGAPMTASVDGEPLLWNATHRVAAGQQITIGAPLRGHYGYLHVGGGFATDPVMGSRAAHLTARVGNAVVAGMTLPIGDDENADQADVKLPMNERFQGGILRITPSAQTARFSKAERARFEATEFTRSPRGNRQGVQLDFEGAPFTAAQQLHILSEIIVPGDIQMTGDGVPFLLLPECQTTGGYPRIATIVPQDQPLAAQAPTGAHLRFQFIPLKEGLETLRSEAQILADLKRTLQPLVRDPRDIRDLLSYQMISGVTAGHDDEGI